MYPEDILVVLYPSKGKLEGIILIDPFDKKVLFHPVDSVNEAKEFLRENIPFCYQHDVPMVHLGKVFVLEWDNLQTINAEIRKPEDIENVLS